MPERTWREASRAVIAELLETHKPQSVEAWMKIARDECPCHWRRGFAYQVWREEVRRQARIMGSAEPTAPTPPDIRNFWITPKP